MPPVPSFRHLQSTKVRKQTTPLWHVTRSNSAYIMNLTSSHIIERRVSTGQYDSLRDKYSHISSQTHSHPFVLEYIVIVVLLFITYVPNL